VGQKARKSSSLKGSEVMTKPNTHKLVPSSREPGDIDQLISIKPVADPKDAELFNNIKHMAQKEARESPDKTLDFSSIQMKDIKPG
jgi:hypothetical protein